MDETTVIINSEELRPLAQYLVELLKPATGFSFFIKNRVSEPRERSISLNLDESFKLKNKEAYRLTIDEHHIEIISTKNEGIFRGLQTLRQLLPATIESKRQLSESWEIATGIITDQPEYSYRSTMLDISRHFFDAATIKRHIRNIALYKINTLHLHLSDDQGWRIEIKSWPNLTTHGAKTEVGGGKGGFLTQEDYKEIVSYAARYFITIVPEIDMPGHTNAALASYPGLNCDNQVRDLYTGTEVGFSSLCTNKELTYQFADDVIREISAITPGRYFHIGGDESHATTHKDYIDFINRVRTIVKKNGKQMIGWEEVAQASIDSSDLIQFWNQPQTAINGIEQGAQVIISPAKYAYLDMKYNSNTLTGQNWAAIIDVKRAYVWNPLLLVNGITKKDIIGIEAPLWTETVKTADDIDYLVFPRLAGIAETGWTPASQKNWNNFRKRLSKHGKRMTQLGINYYPSPLVAWDSNQ